MFRYNHRDTAGDSARAQRDEILRETAAEHGGILREATRYYQRRSDTRGGHCSILPDIVRCAYDPGYEGLTREGRHTQEAEVSADTTM